MKTMPRIFLLVIFASLFSQLIWKKHVWQFDDYLDSRNNDKWRVLTKYTIASTIQVISPKQLEARTFSRWNIISFMSVSCWLPGTVKEEKKKRSVLLEWCQSKGHKIKSLKGLKVCVYLYNIGQLCFCDLINDLILAICSHH